MNAYESARQDAMASLLDFQHQYTMRTKRFTGEDKDSAKQKSKQIEQMIYTLERLFESNITGASK